MRYLNGYLIGGVLFAIVGTAALVVNTLIIAHSGDMQGATADGKQLLAWAALVVHVGGIVVFGLMSGYHSAEGNKRSARLYMAVLLGAALYSGWQVAAFATAEVASQARDRELAEKRSEERFKAGLALDAKRLELQGKLASDQIKANAAAARDSGRREKKDAREESRKLIAEVGKIEVRMPDPVAPSAPGVTVRTQEFAAQVASFVGLDLGAVQAAPTVHLSLMILLFEIICWPQAARNYRLGIAKAARAREALPLQEATTPAVLTVEPEPAPLKALPAPRTPREPKAITVRASMDPEWRELLDKLDFPPPGVRHKGPRRPKDPRDHAALKFLAWMAAFKEGGEFPQAEVDALYTEFCAADHREQWGARVVKAELDALGKRVAYKYGGPDGKMWMITPPPMDRMVSLLERRGVLEPGAMPGLITPGVLRFPKSGTGRP